MSSPNTNDDIPLRPQVVVLERAGEERDDEPLAPRITATEHTGRITPPAPVEPPAAMAVPTPPRRVGTAMRLGLTGIAAACCGWLGIDLYLWTASAFNFSLGLGWAATAVVAAGLAGAALLIGHELRSYLALRNVEGNQQRFAARREAVRPTDLQDAIRAVIAEIPRDRESNAAIEAFQRKLQRHHSPAQQIALFSQTVMTPLDRRAEAIVRRAGARAFGITAISPTAITDALFFIACSVRMVREIASCYGHRPSALATGHLLRRLLVEAGKLGAVDIAGATLSQHIGGAIAERVAASAAESIYAAQRMARLGLVTMELCRPLPFQRSEVPGILSSLVGNLLARNGDGPKHEPGVG